MRKTRFGGFRHDKVFIRKVGEEVILSPHLAAWSSFSDAPVASAEFMEEVEDLPAQEREACCRHVC